MYIADACALLSVGRGGVKAAPAAQGVLSDVQIAKSQGGATAENRNVQNGALVSEVPGTVQDSGRKSGGWAELQKE